MVLSRATIVELAGWVVVACMGLLALTQGVGWTGLPTVYAAQAMTPYLLTPAVPVAAIASSLGRNSMAVVSACIAVALLWLSAPVVFHDDAPSPAADGIQLTIAHANVYLANGEPQRAADVLIGLNTDVIAVTEYSAGIRAALQRDGVDQSHPYRLDQAPGDRNGVALFSRYPLNGEIDAIGHQLGIDATIDVHGTAVRIMVVHPLPGVDRWSLRRWRDDLPVIGDRALTGAVPTVIVGDFNASRWHPAFRRLLGRGLTDAHEQAGHGFSTSWPLDWPVPKFVRLDHALMTEGLVAVHIGDVAMPGSDHEAFAVTVATT